MSHIFSLLMPISKDLSQEEQIKYLTTFGTDTIHGNAWPIATSFPSFHIAHITRVML